MPGAAVVLHQEDNCAILESMTIEGHSFGDTWSLSIAAAKQDAGEYWGADPDSWQQVPESVDDYWNMCAPLPRGI